MANPFRSLADLLEDLIVRLKPPDNSDITRKLDQIIAATVATKSQVSALGIAIAAVQDTVRAVQTSAAAIQADVLLIKNFLGIDGVPITESQLTPLTAELKQSAQSLDESVKANQPS